MKVTLQCGPNEAPAQIIETITNMSDVKYVSGRVLAGHYVNYDFATEEHIVTVLFGSDQVNQVVDTDFVIYQLEELLELLEQNFAGG